MHSLREKEKKRKEKKKNKKKKQQRQHFKAKRFAGKGELQRPY
jgi:hypothetical protein